MNIERLHIPEQFQQAIAGRTLITLEKQTQLEGAKVDVTLAELEAQKVTYLAQGEANKQLALGKAQAEIMQEQLRLGIDPVELKRIEAAEAFAANPGQGTLIDGRTQIVSELLNPSSSNPTIGPVTITGSLVPTSSQSVTPALPSGNSVNGASQATTTSTGAAPNNNDIERQKILDQIYKLNERLLAGEISEQKHTELYTWLQQRLKELP
jgi:hypothetical protein